MGNGKKLKILGITGSSMTDEEFPSKCTEKDVVDNLRSRENIELQLLRVEDCSFDTITRFSPDFVFILIHGGFAENGSLGALIDTLNIPRNGSPAGIEAMFFDKRTTFAALQVSGIVLSPPSVFLSGKQHENFVSPFGFPYIMKPTNSGSSNGVQVIKSEEDAKNFDFGFYEHWIAQPIVGDKEITVAVYPLHSNAIGGFLNLNYETFSNKMKTGGGLAKFPLREPVSNTESKALRDSEEIAQRVYKHFGMRGVARFDFIFNSETNMLYCIDINTLPGIYKKSLSSSLYNRDYSDFIDEIIFGGLNQCLVKYNV